MGGNDTNAGTQRCGWFRATDGVWWGGGNDMYPLSINSSDIGAATGTGVLFLAMRGNIRFYRLNNSDVRQFKATAQSPGGFR